MAFWVVISMSGHKQLLALRRFPVDWPMDLMWGKSIWRRQMWKISAVAHNGVSSNDSTLLLLMISYLEIDLHLRNIKYGSNSTSNRFHRFLPWISRFLPYFWIFLMCFDRFSGPWGFKATDASTSRRALGCTTSCWRAKVPKAAGWARAPGGGDGDVFLFLNWVCVLCVFYASGFSVFCYLPLFCWCFMCVWCVFRCF